MDGEGRWKGFFTRRIIPIPILRQYRHSPIRCLDSPHTHPDAGPGSAPCGSPRPNPINQMSNVLSATETRVNRQRQDPKSHFHLTSLGGF